MIVSQTSLRDWHSLLFYGLQAFSILSETKDEDDRKKQDLLNFYNETESFLTEMDDGILDLLQQNMGNIKEKMNSHKVQLKQKGYFLLVAGTNYLAGVTDHDYDYYYYWY